jgi:hypothetical protein
MLKLFVIAILFVACVDPDPAPAPITSRCFVHNSGQIPIALDRCVTTIGIEVTCSDEPVQYDFDRIIIAWLTWYPVAEDGYVWTSYRCNTVTEATFRTPCQGVISGLGGYEDPIYGTLYGCEER